MTTDDDPSRCRTAALRMLNYRWNSEAELRRKLAAKRFERSVIDTTVAWLREEGWLDDERFAGAFVRTRMLRNIGPQRLRQELIAAGVADDIARRVIGENLEPDREQEGAMVLCEKKMRMIARRHGAAYLRTDEGRKNLATYLLNHGYDASLVFDTIDQCMKVRSV